MFHLFTKYTRQWHRAVIHRHILFTLLEDWCDMCFFPCLGCGHLLQGCTERRVSQACKTLIGQFNLLSVKLGFCSYEVLYSLFQNYCMSLYGSQLWDYSHEAVLASVCVTWRKCVRNIFSIPYNTHCNLVHLIAQDSSVRVKLHKRYLKFFNSASKSSNTLVSMMSRIVINGSGSAACTVAYPGVWCTF